MLSNFGQVGESELAIRVIGKMACTTPAALGEYRAGAGGARQVDAWANLPVVELSPAEVAFAAGLPRPLGPGERSCLAVAVHRRGALATDDLRARAVARRHDATLTGTVGILAFGVHRRRLSLAAADALLVRMIAAGYHSPVPTVSGWLDVRRRP